MVRNSVFRAIMSGLRRWMFVTRPKPQSGNRRRSGRAHPDYPPGQWHRWYAANRKRQRQLTALKRLGFGPIHPTVTGLPRDAVR